MNKLSMILASTACVSVLLSAGCSSAQSDWEKASSQNTVAAYQGFIASHPQDSHASEAKAMVLQLQDNNAWKEAQNAGTDASYQAYLEKFPQGSHALDAKGEQTRMGREAAWKSTQDVGTAAAIQAFLQKYSTGPEVEQAKGKLKDLNGYRIHLASESTDAKAQRKLSSLKSRLGSGAPELVVSPDATGRSFSIDSSGMSQQAAQDACGSLTKKHVPCQVVSQ